MDDIAEILFKNKTPEEMLEIIFNIRRRQLNRKPHVKKYNKLRNLHSEVITSMQNYITSGKYDTKKFDDIVYSEFDGLVDDFDIDFDLENDDDISVFLELFVYKNHKNIPSVTELYIKNNKFRNAEKKKFLECMNNSYASLFKVLDVDSDNGYVTYQDVFSNKKFKIIDIAMSSTLSNNRKFDLYTYNRIITYDDISFATGLHCNFTSDSKKLMKFIKTYKKNKYSDFIRCLFIYDIYKKDSKLKSTYNHRYGYK